MRVLLVDDHAPTRREMCLLVSQEPDLQVVGEAETGEDAVYQARQLLPDVVIMDIALPGMTGVEAARMIVQERPQTRVLALSNHYGWQLVKALLDAGSQGYVRKDRAFEELIPAIRTIVAGQQYLGAHVND